MKKLSSILLFSFSMLLSLHAQTIDKVWPMGYACCQYPGFGAVNLNFTSGNMVMDLIQRHQNLDVTNGSACDSTGNLLFSSNGFYIANLLDDTMQNGSNLNPSYYTNQYKNGGLTIAQGNLVIPSLTNRNQYLLFHNTIDDYFITGASLYFYYSIIDMSQNGGLGAVLNKNTVLYADTMVPGRITTTRHANGRDWWIIVHKLYSTDIIQFLYTPTGFQGPYFKSLSIERDFYYGYMLFNQQGTQFAMYDKFLGIEIADFDRCSGEFSNVRFTMLADTAQDFGAGLAFSPSGRYLYVSSVENLYQYDLADTISPITYNTVGIYDGFIDTVTTSNRTYFWIMALGPDGKIYMSSTNSSPSLHVINSPDSAGIACDFQQHSILLPVVNAFTMPNFPNYSLGREIGSICDSLTNDVGDLNVTNLISIYPNPASQSVRVLYELRTDAELLIYDQLGKQIFQISLFADRSEIILDVSEYENGIYFCKIAGKEYSKPVKFSVVH